MLGQQLWVSSQASVVSFKGTCPRVQPGLFMACGSRLIGAATLGKDVSLWFNAVVRADVNEIVIGDACNIQDGAIVHGTYERFATHIGNRVSVGHGAIVHGCTIEDDVLIGMGATIMDGAVVGKGSVIGAHALVTQGQKIPAGSLVMGSPARCARPLSEDELRAFGATHRRYLDYRKGFAYPDALPASLVVECEAQKPSDREI